MPADGSFSTSFVVIRTDWSVLTALRALDASDATHVILAHHDAGGDQCHLFQADDIFADLQTHATDATLTSVLAAGRVAPDADARTGRCGRRSDAGDRPRWGPPGRVHRPGGPERSRLGGTSAGRAGGPGGWTGEPVVEPVRRGGGHRAKPPAHRPAVANRAGNGGPRPRRAATQRSLEAEFPETVVVDTVEWLLVSIVNAAPTATGLAIEVAAGESIDVLVQPRRGFSVEGDARGTLEVPACRREPAAPVQGQGARRGQGPDPRPRLPPRRAARCHHPGADGGGRAREPGTRTDHLGAGSEEGPAADGAEPAGPRPVVVHRGARGRRRPRVRHPPDGHGPGTRPEPSSVRSVPPRGRSCRVLRDVLPGDRRAAAGDEGTARGRRTTVGGQGCVPDRVADARGPARGAVAGSRSDRLGHHPVRGALDPVGALPADGPGRRPGDRGSVPVRGLRGHPLVAR